MTPDERAAARRRCEAATAGPWETDGESDIYRAGVPRSHESRVFDGWDDGGVYGEKADLTFAAHARTDLPAALDEIDRLEAELAAAKAELAQILATISPT